MRRHPLLPWCLFALSGSLVAAGPGPSARAETTPKKAASTQAPTAAKPSTNRPATTVSKSAPAPSFRVQGSAGGAAPRPKTASAKRESGADNRPLEPSTVGRFLNEWQPRIAASEEYLTTFRTRLAEGDAEVLKILVDRSLLALPSDQNQKLAAIPAAEAQRTYGERDWLRHLQSDADRPAPLKVEQTIQQIEAIAGRPRTSSAETKGLVNKVQNTPGIAAGGYFSTESVAKDLLVPQLRQIPGVLSRASNSQPYAVQHLDALRADFEKKKVGLGEQYRAIRQSLLVDAARAGELQSRYLQLRTNLVAPDE